jgi:hypothetical protein
MQPASRSASLSLRSARESSITPPSEVILPPSKAAVTFSRATAGNEKAAVVSSIMPGVAGWNGEKDLASTTKPYSCSEPYATLASLKNTPP